MREAGAELCLCTSLARVGETAGFDLRLSLMILSACVGGAGTGAALGAVLSAGVKNDFKPAFKPATRPVPESSVEARNSCANGKVVKVSGSSSSISLHGRRSLSYLCECYMQVYCAPAVRQVSFLAFAIPSDWLRTSSRGWRNPPLALRSPAARIDQDLRRHRTDFEKRLRQSVCLPGSRVDILLSPDTIRTASPH